MIPEGTVNRIEYTGNDSAAIYDFPFMVQDEDQLQVWVANSSGTIQDGSNTDGSLKLDTDYMVSGAGEAAGGSVELTSQGQAWIDADNGYLKTGYVLIIRLKPPIEQALDVSNSGAFFQEEGENALDRLTMQDLAQQDEIDRSIKLPPNEDPADGVTELPPAASRAGMLLGFDDTGDLELRSATGTSWPVYSKADQATLVALNPGGPAFGYTQDTGVPYFYSVVDGWQILERSALP